MLEIQELPIYHALGKQRAQAEITIQQDLVDLRLDIDEGMDTLVTRHFNHASQTEHPQASRQHVILSARIHMLEYAAQDINHGKDVDEAVQRIGSIENLFERDGVREAQREAQDLAQRDRYYLKRSNETLVQYMADYNND